MSIMAAFFAQQLNNRIPEYWNRRNPGIAIRCGLGILISSVVTERLRSLCISSDCMEASR